MLKIKSIKFTNDPIFKNKTFDFTKADGKIADCVVIVGENGSGKTRLLKIIHILLRLIKTNLSDEAIKGVASDGKKILSLNTEIEIKIHFWNNAVEIKNFWEKYFKEIYETQQESKDPNLKIKKIYDAIFNDETDTNFCFKFNDPLETSDNKIDIHANVFINNKKIEWESYEIRELISDFFKILDLSSNFLEIKKLVSSLEDKDDSVKNEILDYDLLTKINVFTSNPNLYLTELFIEELENNKKNWNIDCPYVQVPKFEWLINEMNLLNKNIKSDIKIKGIKNNVILLFKKEEEISFNLLSTGEFFVYKLFVFLLDFLEFKNINEIKQKSNELLEKHKEAANNMLYIETKTKSEQSHNDFSEYTKLNIYEKQIIQKYSHLLLIDEIELSLHPTWQSQIFSLIKKLTINNINLPERLYSQIFISTHSPLIPFNINLSTDILINMNDNNKEVSFKNYSSIQNFVEESLCTNYFEMIDETTIWLEGRTDKLILDFCKKHSKKAYPFNFRSSNNVKSKPNDNLEKINKLINGAVGVHTQFWSWVTRDKINNKKPIIFIFDNDSVGNKYYSEIEECIESSSIKINSYLSLDCKKISDNKIFEVFLFKKFFKKEENEEKKELALILKYKEEGTTIENFYNSYDEFKQFDKWNMENELNDLTEELAEKFKDCFSEYLDNLLLLINNISNNKEN